MWVNTIIITYLETKINRKQVCVVIFLLFEIRPRNIYLYSIINYLEIDAINENKYNKTGARMQLFQNVKCLKKKIEVVRRQRN